MKPLRQIIFLGCVVASFIAGAGEQLSPETKGAADKKGAVERQLLQGKWVGTMVGDQAHQKITVTITDRSLHFHRDTNFWLETTFTLPPGPCPEAG